MSRGQWQPRCIRRSVRTIVSVLDCQINNTDNNQLGYRAGVLLRERVQLRRMSLRGTGYVNKTHCFLKVAKSAEDLVNLDSI